MPGLKNKHHKTDAIKYMMKKSTRSVRTTDVKKEWFLVDAGDKVLGRLCSNIAKILRGKHKPTFTPNADTGDFVVVINADRIRLTGKKSETKTYDRYSGYPGGLKTTKYSELSSRFPDRIIINAVRGMLPHNKLGRSMIGKLKVYKGPDHPHKSQDPKAIQITKEQK